MESTLQKVKPPSFAMMDILNLAIALGLVGILDHGAHKIHVKVTKLICCLSVSFFCNSIQCDLNFKAYGSIKSESTHNLTF